MLCCLSVGGCHSNAMGVNSPTDLFPVSQNNIFYTFYFYFPCFLLFDLLVFFICLQFSHVSFGFSWIKIAFTKMALHFHTYRTVWWGANLIISSARPSRSHFVVIEANFRPGTLVLCLSVSVFVCICVCWCYGWRCCIFWNALNVS